MSHTSIRYIKYLLIAKFVALIGFLAIRFGVITIGDRSIFAEEKTAEAPKTKGAPEQEAKELLKELLALPPLDEKKSSKAEIERFLAAAKKAKIEVETKGKETEKKISDLKKMERLLDSKLKALQEERDFFIKTVQKEKDLGEERLKDIVDLYAKMEPKKAAPIIEKLDKDLVVNLFKKLTKKQVTRILEAMTPEASTTITEYYGRVGSAREYDLLKELNTSLKDEFNVCKADKKPSPSPEEPAPAAPAPVPPADASAPKP